MKTTEEIVSWVDERITTIIHEAEHQADFNDITLAGAVAGMLLKTGIRLSAKWGVPKDLLTGAVAFAIEEAYK